MTKYDELAYDEQWGPRPISLELVEGEYRPPGEAALIARELLRSCEVETCRQPLGRSRRALAWHKGRSVWGHQECVIRWYERRTLGALCYR